MADVLIELDEKENLGGSVVNADALVSSDAVPSSLLSNRSIHSAAMGIW